MNVKEMEMSLNKIIRTSLLAMALLAPQVVLAAAPAKLYDCRFTKGSDRKWVAPQIIILREDGAKTATVSDGLIIEFEGKPLTAKVILDGKRRLVFEWKLHIKDNSNNTAVMTYTASMEKATGKVDVRANPYAYDNNFTRSGKCTATAVKPGQTLK